MADCTAEPGYRKRGDFYLQGIEMYAKAEYNTANMPKEGMQMNVPAITLRGSAFEKGLLHGSQCRAQVMRSLETYRHRYQVQRGLSWEDATKLAKRFEPVLQGEYLRYAEEMHGIAEGAGLAFEDILALNLRSEILYSGIKDMHFEPDECTAFCALSPATEGGHVLAGQTWDYTMAQREASFIARIPAEDGRPPILLFLEGGMVGGKGVSGAGICLTINALSSKAAAIGLPLHVRMRSALEKKDFSDTIRECLKTPVPVPANLLLACKDGLSFSIELDPEGTEVLEPENGILVHTNHYKGIKQMLTHSSAASGSTYIRNQRMTYLLHSKQALSMKDLEGFVRDHAGYPTSICAHPASDTPKEELAWAGATNYAFIADLTAERIRFVMGNPCEGEFEDLKLEG